MYELPFRLLEEAWVDVQHFYIDKRFNKMSTWDGYTSVETEHMLTRTTLDMEAPGFYTVQRYVNMIYISS